MKPALLYILTFLVGVACNTSDPKAASTPSKQEIDVDADSDQTRQDTLSGDKVTGLYINAISEYLKAANKDGGPMPDTVFVWKHPDFPDIALPQAILHSKIRMLPFLDTNGEQNRKNCVYLNMFCWLTANKAEFVIVTFRHGGKPQHNCKMDFRYDEEARDFVLNRLSFEYPYRDNNRIKKSTTRQ